MNMIFKSKSELKRALKSGTIKVNGKKVYNPKYIMKKGDLIQIGRGRFIEVTRGPEKMDSSHEL